MSRNTIQQASAVMQDPRWQDVQLRQRQANSHFVYAVTTTGIYCRPGCAARLPKPENVIFFADADAAEQAGYRACLRCKPRQSSLGQQQAELIAAACRRIQQAELPLSLQQLAGAANMSSYHFHRLFKTMTGLTPKEYARANRQQRLQQMLETSDSVTEALYAAGYQSSSRFYAEAVQLLGMTAGEYRAGAPKAQIRFAIGQCSLGAILVAQSEKGVCAVLLGDDPQSLLQELQDQFPHATLLGAHQEFEQLIAQLVGLVEQPQHGLCLPLDIQGTAFQQRVWRALQQIPPGETLSYSEVAARIASPQAARAVASACAANCLALLIPCHRVVRQDGQAGGYRWGIARKQTLLDREKQ